MGWPHHDALRPKGRARRPRGGVFAVSPDLILRARLRASRRMGHGLMVRDSASAPPHHEEHASELTATSLRLPDPRLLRVGRFPHHALAPLAAEQLDRIAVIDVTELALVDAVAAQFLQAARKALCGLPGNAELQVFLLPHPAPAIGAGKREP